MNNHIFGTPVMSVEAGRVGPELQREDFFLRGNVMGVSVTRARFTSGLVASFLTRCT